MFADAYIHPLLFFALVILFCKLIFGEICKGRKIDKWFLRESIKLDRLHYRRTNDVIREIIEESKSQLVEGEMTSQELSTRICIRLFGKKRP